MALQKYNPRRIVGSWTGKIGTRDFAFKFVAFMDGTFLEAEYNEDRITRHDGSDGTATFVVNANTGAKVTATFTQGSPINTLLSQMIPNAERNYMPVGVLQFEDLNGNTKVKAAEAVIAKVAKVDFSNGVMGRAWTWELAQAEILVGEAGDF